jgi:uncharacterized RDD family membrane protein YckC
MELFMDPLNPKRNKAFFIDAVIYVMAIVFPFSLVGVLPGWLGGKAFIVGMTLGVLYIVFRDGWNGQSIGKRIFKIQVVRKRDRKPIGFFMAFCRGFLTSLPVLGWIDFVLTTFTANSQRFTDKILGTELISK